MKTTLLIKSHSQAFTIVSFKIYLIPAGLQWFLKEIPGFNRRKL